MAARAEIVATEMSRAGIAVPVVTAGVVADGHKFQNNGRVFLQVQNVAVAARILTIVIPGLVDGLAIGDRAVSVTASTTFLIGPFPPDIYNQNDGTGNSNMVYLDYPGGNESDLKVQVLRLP